MHQSWQPLPRLARPNAFRPVVLVLAGAALAVAALAAVRLLHVISFSTPLQLVTSGAEEEALASIWRGGHGGIVFTDPRLVPFTASYFNWLFYVVYARFAECVQAAFHLGDAWLPTVCRLLTLSFALVGSFLTYRLLRHHAHARLGRPAAFALAALTFFNPLCGFWIVTTRPDIGAALLELAGVACALRQMEEKRWRWSVSAGLCFAAAWAFKQTSIGALVGIIAAGLLPGTSTDPSARRRQAIAVCAIVVSSALLACVTLGPVYRHGLYGPQANCGFHPSLAFSHTGTALLKMPFLAAALAAVFPVWRRIRIDPVWRALSFVLLASFALDFLGSSKAGAGDYYFITAGLWSVIWLGVALDRLEFTWLTRVLVVAGLGQIGAVAAALLAHRGVIDPADPTRPYEHLAAILATQPGPVLVRDEYGDLPWISPTRPHFVIGYANDFDLPSPDSSQRGWRELVARGYFALVVIRAGQPTPSGLASIYCLTREEAGWCFFQRNDPAKRAVISPEKNRAASR